MMRKYISKKRKEIRYTFESIEELETFLNKQKVIECAKKVPEVYVIEIDK